MHSHENRQTQNHEVTKNTDDFSYELLVGHNRTDGTYKNDKELRMEYIQRTDGLIYKMTHGVEVLDPETGEKVLKKPDSVIFLDKSARPLAWLTNDLWDKLAKNGKDDATEQKPDFYFLNIDREQWTNTVSPDGSGRVDVSKLDPTIIRSLRSIFVSPNDKRNGLTEEVEDANTILDGQTIMVVDEVYSTGRTLNIATQMIQKALPDSNVVGEYWMGGIAQRGTAQGNADLPVWYKEKDVFGRGVGNRLDDGGDGKSKNLTQRLGGWFLSTRHLEFDEKAHQLRKEFKQLSTNPDVPIRPSNEREDAAERLVWLNDNKDLSLIRQEISTALGKKLGR